jgi:hypothetical protein
MKPRRWFATPDLLQWKHMQDCGDYAGPFFSFPHDPWGLFRLFVDPYENSTGEPRRGFISRESTTPVIQ